MNLLHPDIKTPGHKGLGHIVEESVICCNGRGSIEVKNLICIRGNGYGSSKPLLDMCMAKHIFESQTRPKSSCGCCRLCFYLGIFVIGNLESLVGRPMMRSSLLMD